MDILFNFSCASSFDEFIRVNERFHFALSEGKDFSFFRTSLFFLSGTKADRLKEDFNCAMGCIQMFEKWKECQASKNSMPFLQYDAVIDDHSTELEIKLNKIIRSVDDEFWDTYFPLNSFSDRSCIRQLRDATVTEVPKDLPIPINGFDKNLSKPFLIHKGVYSFVIHNNEYNISIIKNSNSGQIASYA